MNPVTIAYLALLAGATYALWQTMPHSRAELRPALSVPEHVGATEDSPALTGEIARIESDPDVPALLSGREEREIEDTAYAAIFAECDAALFAELDRFRAALEPVRQVLKIWHDNGDGCLICAKRQLDAQRPAARLARVPVLRSSVSMC